MHQRQKRPLFGRWTHPSGEQEYPIHIWFGLGAVVFGLVALALLSFTVTREWKAVSDFLLLSLRGTTLFVLPIVWLALLIRLCLPTDEDSTFRYPERFVLPLIVVTLVFIVVTILTAPLHFY